MGAQRRSRATSTSASSSRAASVGETASLLREALGNLVHKLDRVRRARAATLPCAPGAGNGRPFIEIEMRRGHPAPGAERVLERFYRSPAPRAPAAAGPAIVRESRPARRGARNSPQMGATAAEFR